MRYVAAKIKNQRCMLTGILVLVTTLLCLFWQANYGNGGTSKGYSKYNLFHVIGEISEHAFSGNQDAVVAYAKILIRENRYAAAEFWLKYFIRQYPEKSQEVSDFLQKNNLTPYTR